MPTGGEAVIDTRDLRRRVDLLALIGEDTRLKKVATTRGGEYAGPCPFCGGRDRLRVQPERGRWWCRHCSEDARWQDALAYVMRRDGLDFKSAAAMLGGAPGAPVAPHSRPAPPPAAPELAPSAAWRRRALAFVEGAERALWAEPGERARDWLQGRGLRDDTLRAWRVGFHPADAWDDPARWGLDRGPMVRLPRGVVLPWFAAGELWHVKVRRAAGRPKYVAIAGGRPVLFGADTLAGRAVGVLAEGEFDALLLWQAAGDLVGVATLGGCGATPGPRALGHLLPVARLLVAYDADAPGERGAARLAALSARLRLLRPPPGQDLTDFVLAGGDLRAWLA
ncbi:MAG TPA: primase-helicase zinc-binding domain-containing protein, partial [Thermomicrobiales bacterium]|nr:primase-helicase zinc-binding domain-containing protein [Thermomicrobiales bacterium]